MPNNRIQIELASNKQDVFNRMVVLLGLSHNLSHGYLSTVSTWKVI